ncbi:MAG: glycosyltransferase [Burkholderiales bacterium]
MVALASIVILNWNGLSVLGPCLAAIAENTLIDDYEVIVLDNGSAESGIEEVVKPYPKVKLIREPVNHGFSRGNNLAIQQATGEYVVIVNNDTLPRRDWLRPMIDMHRRIEGVGIVGSQLVNAANQTLFAGAYFQPEINAYVDAYRNYPPGAASEPRECEVYIACGILLRRDLFDQVGGFDEHYFQGYEDFDLCLKVRERGLKVMYCPDSMIEHLENVSMKKLSRRIRRRSKEKNREYFEARWQHRIHEFRLPSLPKGLGDFSYYTFPRERLAELVPKAAQAVLEVGCGAGLLGESLKKANQGRVVTGIELDPQAAALAGLRLDQVLVANIETMSLEPLLGRFDALITADVLEHLVNPWAALFRLRDCLKDDGTLVASIPNIAHYKIIKKLLFRAWRYEPGGILDRTHLRFFTRGSIEDLMRFAGFDIVHIEREGRQPWWSRWFGPFSERVRDFTAVQFYVVAKKRRAGHAAQAK